MGKVLTDCIIEDIFTAARLSLDHEDGILEDLGLSNDEATIALFPEDGQLNKYAVSAAQVMVRHHSQALLMAGFDDEQFARVVVALAIMDPVGHAKPRALKP